MEPCHNVQSVTLGCCRTLGQGGRGRGEGVRFDTSFLASLVTCPYYTNQCMLICALSGRAGARRLSLRREAHQR